MMIIVASIVRQSILCLWENEYRYLLDKQKIFYYYYYYYEVTLKIFQYVQRDLTKKYS
jgi:hypothetical protein